MNPFPGIRPFTVDEKKYYFGREAILSDISLQAQVCQLTVLFARSGVGKSSFLTCRLIPELKNESHVEYLNEWGSDKPENLILERLDCLRSIEHKTMEAHILILDQFEDVFKSPHSKTPLWELLAEIVNIHQSEIHVLISMREEWLGAWGEAGEFLPDALKNIIRLIPLTKKEVIRSIMKPVQVENSIAITEEIAEQIIVDLQEVNVFGLGRQYVEPGMLQLVCGRLWNEANECEHKVMDNKLYNELGGAKKISHEYVWKHLGEINTQKTEFSIVDRVLWCGIINQLVAAQGIKSIVSANSISKAAKLTDFGVAGIPIISKRLGIRLFSRKASKEAFDYLKIPVGKRETQPPKMLVEWITEVLEKGIRAGFLKRQSSQKKGETLVELSHDTLGDILQKFAAVHETWIQKRVIYTISALFIFLFITPFFGYIWYERGWDSALFMLLVYGGIMIVWLMVHFIFVKLFSLVWNPIVRWLCRGRVPNN